ncbi:MAG: hypothetical protein C0506_03680, partial [Anaerolinea sp.]|nr:hypothetical protein [Anaerolinea sp.]
LIARALMGRSGQYPATAAAAADITGTLDFLRYATRTVRQFPAPPGHGHQLGEPLAANRQS